MERLEFGIADALDRTAKSKGKKRKWREIESLKERYRLRRELQELDLVHDYTLEEIEL